MYFVNCRYPVAVVIYCVAAWVLVTVNGQPTTDDNVQNDEIAQLRVELTNLKGQLVDKTANLERQLAALDRGQYMTVFVSLHLLRLLGEICTA